MLIPDWLQRPLPANSIHDDTLLAEVDALCKELPQSVNNLTNLLAKHYHSARYTELANHVAAAVWPLIPEWLNHENANLRKQLLVFARQHLPMRLSGRICRRLAKDPDRKVRTYAIVGRSVHEVALPTKPGAAWDTTGWRRGTGDVDMRRHLSGKFACEKHHVPPIASIGALRELLGIRSEKQLGYMLLATHDNDGPYVRFHIPKRDGTDRSIDAPKRTLKYTQRAILSEILSKVPIEDAAHGFVPGRSTVTNATPHVGASILVKFDLKDFFPTIHFYRVLGMFASLGYPVGTMKFKSKDKSRSVAPTLARLCCHTPKAKSWNNCKLPQGAPTSPAISNIICNMLDKRLTGLAKKVDATYTRYADDLTFSFQDSDAVAIGRLRWWVDQICQQEGFTVNTPKFRVIRPSQRQVVTGLVVNKELHIPRIERRRFRAILHNCQTHGVASQARDNPQFPEYLRGFAAYMHMVEPEANVTLLATVNELLRKEGTS